MKYNGDQFLESVYKSISESKAGQEKTKVHAELRNKFVPVAADYSHRYEYGATEDDETLVSWRKIMLLQFNNLILGYQRHTYIPHL